MNAIWHPETRDLLATAIFLALGFLAGMLHFHLLQRQALMLVQGVSAWRCVLLHLLRFALMVIALFAAANKGALALLAALAGTLLARKILLSLARDH
jgi:hypothetical protein